MECVFEVGVCCGHRGSRDRPVGGLRNHRFPTLFVLSAILTDIFMVYLDMLRKTSP
jgi:hypothetical protein